MVRCVTALPCSVCNGTSVRKTRELSHVQTSLEQVRVGAPTWCQDPRRLADSCSVCRPRQVLRASLCPGREGTQHAHHTHKGEHAEGAVVESTQRERHMAVSTSPASSAQWDSQTRVGEGGGLPHTRLRRTWERPHPPHIHMQSTHTHMGCMQGEHSPLYVTHGMY